MRSIAGNKENPPDALSRVERDLENLRNALSLLGIKPCCWCGKFFRRSEVGKFFDCGELVCSDCIHEWWPSQSAQLSVKEREVVERKLVNWLVNHRRGKIVRQSAKLREGPQQGDRIVVSCAQCDGTGRFGERDCQGCDGRGTIWLVIPRA